MLVERAYRKETAYVHAQADHSGALAAYTVRNRTRKRADKGIHHRQRQKEQCGNVGTKAVGVLKIKRRINSDAPMPTNTMSMQARLMVKAEFAKQRRAASASDMERSPASGLTCGSV